MHQQSTWLRKGIYIYLLPKRVAVVVSKVEGKQAIPSMMWSKVCLFACLLVGCSAGCSVGFLDCLINRFKPNSDHFNADQLPCEPVHRLGKEILASFSLYLELNLNLSLNLSLNLNLNLSLRV